MYIIDSKDISSGIRAVIFNIYWNLYQYLVISFQKSAAVHLARHCPSTRTERIFMDWLWWILQGLPFTHLVSYCNLTVLIKNSSIICTKARYSSIQIQKTPTQQIWSVWCLWTLLIRDWENSRGFLPLLLYFVFY